MRESAANQKVRQHLKIKTHIVNIAFVVLTGEKFDVRPHCRSDRTKNFRRSLFIAGPLRRGQTLGVSVNDELKTRSSVQSVSALLQNSNPLIGHEFHLRPLHMLNGMLGNDAGHRLIRQWQFLPADIANDVEIRKPFADVNVDTIWCWSIPRSDIENYRSIKINSV